VLFHPKLTLYIMHKVSHYTTSFSILLGVVEHFNNVIGLNIVAVLHILCLVTNV